MNKTKNKNFLLTLSLEGDGVILYSTIRSEKNNEMIESYKATCVNFDEKYMKPNMKSIAIIGSSGGNLYNLGGKDPEKLLQEIIAQSSAAGLTISTIQFIAADESMDSVKETTKTRVFTSDNDGQPVQTFTGQLLQANQIIKKLDKEIILNTLFAKFKFNYKKNNK